MDAIDTEPLLSPAETTLREALAFPPAHYGARFVDLAFWRPYVARIATAHGLPVEAIAAPTPGSFPTFLLNGTHVAKLFGTHFDGLQCWAVERDVAAILDRAGLRMPVPRIVASGVLSVDPDWRYIVQAVVPGASFAAVSESLAPDTRMRVAESLGGMLRGLHDLEIPPGSMLGDGWDTWRAFIEEQATGIAERHRAWGVLPERMIGEVEAYVAGCRVPEEHAPSLVHADLHGDHLFGEATDDVGWRVLGIIDWGDALLGDRFYELPALHLGLFRGDRAMLAAFLASYGLPGFRAEAFVRRAMAMTLLHEFNVLDEVAGVVDLSAVASLDELAEEIWRV